jgi:hypothetical protein
MMEMKIPTKAEQKATDAREKLRMKEITKEFKRHLVKPAKMHFFDGTVITGRVYKQGRSYYLIVNLENILGIDIEETPPVRIPNITEFLHHLRKIHIPIVY